MTVTYRQLADLDLALWLDCATGWRRLAQRIAQQAGELTRAGASTRQAWSGGLGASAAHGALTETTARLAACRGPLLEADQVMTELAERMRVQRERLLAIVRGTEGTLVRVSDSGQVVLDASRSKPDAGDVSQARRVAAELTATLRAAEQVDAEAVARLHGLSARAVDGFASTPATIPQPATAAQVTAWWSALSPQQRQWLVDREPERIGQLDGVPADARDRANRLLLDRELDRPGDADRLARLRHLASRLDGDQPRRYLLGFQAEGDGRAVIAIGNPDRSDNVATFVPGVGVTLDRCGGELERAAALQARATVVDSQASTSSIMWLGYDAPDGIDGGFQTAALAARDDLRGFQDGLVATHQGELRQQTLLGHSYGSLVVGLAERDGAVAADDLVLLGSPGVGVDRAAELRDPGQVWSSTASNDIIRLTPSLGEVAISAPLGPLSLLVGSLVDVVVHQNADILHGVDPSSRQFGGQTFGSARGHDPLDAHASYFDADNPSLQAMAQIVTGTTPR